MKQCAQRGMSLIELMIGLVISLLIIGVVAAVFVNANRNFAQDQRVGRMQENARYAMHIIAQDLSMIGFWGPLMDTSSINAQTRNCTTSPDISDPSKCAGFFANSILEMASGDDCGPGTSATAPANWAYDIDRFVEIVTESTAANAETIFDCIDEDEFFPDTDILVIKRLHGLPLDAARADSNDDGKIYLRTNGDAGMIMQYDSSAAVPLNTEDWQYLIHLYYIQDYFLADGDAIPTLYRKTLSGNAMDIEVGGVAQGIEHVHVMFGVDAGTDGIPDYYTSSPTVVEERAAVTAKIYVLARSLEADQLYNNAKSYQLGDVIKDFSGSPDNFYRRVFTTTVQLRNRVHFNRIAS